MDETNDDPVISGILSEINQDHETRKDLFTKIEDYLGRPLVTLFTSFKYPVQFEDTDVDMMADMLQKLDLSNGLALMINSPGGDGVAAERMINVCRNYSQKGEYWTIVPGKAKSAATLICFGASKIIMGPASELGPVDPQITIAREDRVQRYSVFNIVESYNDLFSRAVKESGNLEPYLQQLANFDERDIKEYRSAIDLSKDISIRALEAEMMKGTKRDEIEKKIQIFLTPKKTKTHGRPIYRDEAEKCGFVIEKINAGDDIWPIIYELYLRSNEFVSRQVSKCIESKTNLFVVGPTE